MALKEILEGMTGQQAAQIILENDKENETAAALPVSSLDYFINGFQKSEFIEEINRQSAGLETGIVTVSNGIRTSTTAFVSKRNYVLGSAMFAEVSISAVSGGTNDTFFLGIKEDNSIVELISRTAGVVDNITLDLSRFKSVSFTFESTTARPQFVKFYKGQSAASENNVKKYIDEVSAQLDGIVKPATNVETIINSGYAGAEKKTNTILKEDGTTGTSTGLVTLFKLDVKKYSIANLFVILYNAGNGAVKNAVIVGYKADGTIVDLYPLAVDSAGTQIDEGFNIEDFDFLSVGYTSGGAGVFKLTLIGSEIEPQQVKKYVDSTATKTGAISNPSSKFSLTRKGLMMTATQALLPSIYWPSIIETSKIASPLGKYYIYFSTDHGGSAGSSKINLAYSNNLITWKQYGTIVTALNQLGTVGESETPSVVWDDFAQEFRMYWQTNPDPSGLGYAQSTQISRSTDGINWTYIKTALNIPLVSITGNGHNGYFTPVQFDNMYVATHLMGGTDQSYSTFSYSYDGLNWLTSPNLISRQMHGVFAEGVYSGGAQEAAVFVYNGRFYSICAIGIPASGLDPKVTNIGVTELCDDLTVRGKAELVLLMDGANESTDIRSIRYFQDTDGAMYIIYNCNDRFFLSKLEAKF